MGKTRNHLSQLSKIVREEGVLAAIKHDARETVYDVESIAEEVFFGGPIRTLMTLGAVLAVPAYVLGTTVKAGFDAASYSLGADRKQETATFVESQRVPFSPYGGELDIGKFRFEDGREFYVDDWQRPIDGKFLSNLTMGCLEPGQQYKITTVGFGDMDGDTLLKVEETKR